MNPGASNKVSPVKNRQTENQAKGTNQVQKNLTYPQKQCNL
jgi:hypothetical protein